MRNLLLILAMACKGPVSTESTDETGATPLPTGFCGELEVSQGQRVCAESVRNPQVLADLDDGGVPWVLPVESDAPPFPPVVLNANQTSVLAFLQLAAPGLEDLTQDRLGEAIWGERREFSVGLLFDRGDHVGFTFDEGDGWEVGYDDVKLAFEALQEIINEDARGGVDLVFEPDADQADRVGGWRPNFPIDGVVEPTYVAYTDTPVVGTLRILDRAAFEAGQEAGRWGPGDILVLEDAEQDTERIVAGVISNEPLPAFSRVVERANNRGTAACFQEDATLALATFADQLVRVTCGATAVEVTTATQAEADAFRAGLVGAPVSVVPADFSTVELQPLLTLDTTESSVSIAQYGLESTRVGTAYQNIPGALQLRGVAVPVAFFQDFLERNTFVTDLGTGPAAHTYREVLDAWLTDPTYLDDPAERRLRLEGLAQAMRLGQVDPLLAQRLNDLLPTVFGSPLTVVRVTPSVNLADQTVLPFADLYDAGSGCVADDLDGDLFGPSACEAARPDERPLAVAVAEAYASLWTMAAYEQRAFHGVDHTAISVGLLVTDRVVGELADIVVRTPGGDGPLLISAQPDDLSAVGRASEHPELTEFTPSSGRIVRLQGSSEVSRGEQVLTDTQIASLADAVETVRDDGGSSAPQITEWKLLGNGAWALKNLQPVR